MIDVAYENVIAFDMLDKTLDGRELLESKVSQTIEEGKNKGFENVIKLYFDLDNLEEKKIYIESEKYVERDLISNKKYLLPEAPRGNSAYLYPSMTNIFYLIGIEFRASKKYKKIKRVEKISNIKNPIYYIFEKINMKKELKSAFFKILTNFYRYRLLDKNVYLSLCSSFQSIETNELLNPKQFLKKYQEQNIFTIGYILNGKKYLLSDNEDYINILLSDKREGLDDSKLKIEGICDFCKKTKKLINAFGSKPYALKSLKNFTSTMPSVFYENDKKTLNKNIRCCIDCFTKISQADYKLNNFQIGTLKEECINCKNKQMFTVYAFIDTPFEQNIDYENIKFGMKSIFGYKNVLDTTQKVVRSDDIFDEDWNIILNFFIVDRGSKKEKNETVLNLRNINPHLFRKYHKIFEFINELNQELTYRRWKGNFSDIFSTISKADKRVSFEIFEAFLNEKEFNSEGLIERFLPLVKRKFLASETKKKEEPYLTHYKYLLLDITNILIIDNLRKKENILSFEMTNLIESYEDKNKKKRYRKKATKEIVEALSFEWSDLEIGLFDLGMIIQESVSEIKQNKSTDIEKVFMRKMDFTGMRVDEVMNYIGYIEQKFQEYKSSIHSININNRQERLAHLGMALNQKEIETSPQKSAYLIAFGYEMSLTISNKIGNIVNKEKEEKK